MVDGLIEGKQLKFYLANIHFHTPSEHKLEGNNAAMEAHFVHSLDLDYNSPRDFLLTKLVIGVLFDGTSQTPSSFLERVKIGSESVFSFKNSVGRKTHLISSSFLKSMSAGKHITTKGP